MEPAPTPAGTSVATTTATVTDAVPPATAPAARKPASPVESGTVLGIILLPIGLIVAADLLCHDHRRPEQPGAAGARRPPDRSSRRRSRPLHIALICIAMGAGATSTSHVNDAGYWLVSRFFGISEKDTLKSWTVLETIMGFAAFGVAVLLSLVV